MRDMQIRLSRSISIILLFFGILFLASCGSTSHHYYATDEGNLLALRKEKDLRASGGYTPHANSLPGHNINVQVGYSPIKNLGIYTNFFRIRNSFEGFEGEKKNVYQNSFSGAIGGYVFKKGTDQINYDDEDDSLVEYSSSEGKGLLLDAYLGYSRGSVRNFFFEETGRVELDFQKIFLQAGVHIFLDKIGASFSLRYSNLDYLDGFAFGKLTTSQLNKLDIISENNPFNLLESSLKISVGKPTAPIRGYMTVSGIYDFGDVFLEIQPSTMQLGIETDINYWFKKR